MGSPARVVAGIWVQDWACWPHTGFVCGVHAGRRVAAGFHCPGPTLPVPPAGPGEGFCFGPPAWAPEKMPRQWAEAGSKSGVGVVQSPLSSQTGCSEESRWSGPGSRGCTGPALTHSLSDGNGVLETSGNFLDTCVTPSCQSGVGGTESLPQGNCTGPELGRVTETRGPPCRLPAREYPGARSLDLGTSRWSEVSGDLADG